MSNVGVVKKSNRGGRRAGSGRKPLNGGTEAMVVASIYMSTPQREKLRRIGGAGWVRNQIDAAPEGRRLIGLNDTGLISLRDMLKKHMVKATRLLHWASMVAIDKDISEAPFVILPASKTIRCKDVLIEFDDGECDWESKTAT